MDQNSSVKSQLDGVKLFMILLIGFLIVASMGVAAYYYNQYQKTQVLLKDPGKATQEENKALVAKLSQMMELPAEAPTVATVIDKTKLTSQPFFARAENQDKVLIYTQSRKAILYRPSTNKIIEVAPITIGNGDQQNNQGQVAGADTSNVTPTVEPSSFPTLKPLPTFKPLPTLKPLPTSTPPPGGP